MNKIILPLFLMTLTAFSARFGIYGSDERLSPSWSQSQKILDILPAIGARVHKAYIRDKRDGTVTLQGAKVSRRHNVCPNERFAQDVSVASCSGFLVAPNILLTAAHCLTPKKISPFIKLWESIFWQSPRMQRKVNHRRALRECQDFSWVFNFNDVHNNLEINGSFIFHNISKEYVANCEDILFFKNNEEQSQDYVLVKLDRSIPVEPLSFSEKLVDRSGDLGDFIMIGHPLGSPAKISHCPDCPVQNNRKYFRIPIDAFVGNSGSPVLDENYKVLGILRGGSKDFNDARSGQCKTYYKCSRVNNPLDENCLGEQILKIPNRIKRLTNLHTEQ